jgi:hypothetical protein
VYGCCDSGGLDVHRRAVVLWQAPRSCRTAWRAGRRPRGRTSRCVGRCTQGRDSWIVCKICGMTFVGLMSYVLPPCVRACSSWCTVPCPQTQELWSTIGGSRSSHRGSSKVGLICCFQSLSQRLE